MYPVLHKETSSETKEQHPAKKPYGPHQKFSLMPQTDPLCKVTTQAESIILQANTMPTIPTSHVDLYTYAVQTTLRLPPQTPLSLVDNQFETMLKNTPLNSTPLNFSAPPKTPLQRFDEDPAWLLKQENRNQNEAVAQMGSAIGAVVKEAIGGFIEEVGGNIERVKREAFNPSNPHSLFYEGKK